MEAPFGQLHTKTPYKFGLIGSTDSHTSLATADEDNFFGKAANVEPGKDRWNHPLLYEKIIKRTFAAFYAFGIFDFRSLWNLFIKLY
ncbi:DUF3604 domain-containing protein [Lutimonas vermicola]|uniref:DUF3604 domain-containing protein n=1 Tax=Lutimonas vermicola TaxID=414288 RepID=A0ABU9KZY5_9FLAO